MLTVVLFVIAILNFFRYGSDRMCCANGCFGIGNVTWWIGELLRFPGICFICHNWVGAQRWSESWSVSIQLQHVRNALCHRQCIEKSRRKRMTRREKIGVFLWKRQILNDTVNKKKRSRRATDSSKSVMNYEPWLNEDMWKRYSIDFIWLMEFPLFASDEWACSNNGKNLSLVT